MVIAPWLQPHYYIALKLVSVFKERDRPYEKSLPLEKK